MKVSIIAAIGQNRELGKDNKLLWNIPGELKRFKAITMGHPIIMGRKTFESIRRVLPGRTNIIISRDKNYKVDGAVVVNSLKEALKVALKIEKSRGVNKKPPLGWESGEIFIIGGGQIFEQALPSTDKLYLTIVHKTFDADTFFPEYDEFKKVIERVLMKTDEFDYEFLTLKK